MTTYQIRNVDREGGGSFYYAQAPDCASDVEICDAIIFILDHEKAKHDGIKYFGWKPFSTRKMRVVELDGDYKVKNGRKGYAYLSSIKAKGKNVLTGERFEKVSSCFKVCLEEIAGRGKDLKGNK